MEFFGHYFFMGMFVLSLLAAYSKFERIPFIFQAGAVFVFVFATADIMERKANSDHIVKAFSEGKNIKCPETPFGSKSILSLDKGWIMSDSRHFSNGEKEVYLNSSSCEVVNEPTSDSYTNKAMAVFIILEILISLVYLAKTDYEKLFAQEIEEKGDVDEKA